MLKQGFVFQCGVEEVRNRENLTALSLSPCSYERPLLYFYISLTKQNVDNFSLIV